MIPKPSEVTIMFQGYDDNLSAKNAKVIASRAIERGIEATSKPRIAVSHLAYIAFGGSEIPTRSYKRFLDAARYDPRLSPHSLTEHAIKGRDQTFEVQMEGILELADKVLKALQKMPSGRVLNIGNIIMSARREGHFLLKEEIEALTDIIMHDPKVSMIGEESFVFVSR